MNVRKLVLAVVGSIVLLAPVAPEAVAAEAGVGVHKMEISLSERERPLDVTVWYPAASGG